MSNTTPEAFADRVAAALLGDLRDGPHDVVVEVVYDDECECHEDDCSHDGDPGIPW